MAVELVVKIPEEAYKLLKNEGVDWLGAEHILNAVANGTVLPKGHGDLIDRSELKKDDEVNLWLSNDPVRTGKTLKMFSELFIKKIDKQTPIIEAEKEE